MKNALKIIAFFSAILLSSCSLFEEESLISTDFLKTKSGLKIWKLKSYGLNGQSILSDCTKDDTFVFDQDAKEYQWKKNQLSCFEGDKDESFEFIWSEDKKTMKINGNDFQVVSIDHGNLILKMVLSGHTYDLWYIPA